VTPDHPTTLILRPGNQAGFFCNFNFVICALAHSLGKDGVQAVRVDWRHQSQFKHFPYRVNDHENTWDRLFQPLAFDHFPQHEEEFDLHHLPGGEHLIGRRAYRDLYGRNQAWREEYHQVYREYVHLQPDVEAEVNAFVESQMGEGPCVGVHYRDPKHREGPTGRPSLAYFIERTQALLPAGGTGRVFLATDVEEAVQAFRDAFGERVVYTDAQRQSLNETVQLHHRQDGGGRDLGREVLIDCLLLARCDTFLFTTSHLATAVGFINPRLQLIYCEPSRAKGLAVLWLKKGFRTLTRKQPRQEKTK